MCAGTSVRVAAATSEFSNAMMGGAAASPQEPAFGRLTRQQFIDAAKRALLDHPEGFNRIVRPWTEASVAIADVDGDGEITLEQWGRLLRAMGGNDAAVKRRLKATDADGDGRLSVRDLLSTAQTYYTTDDDMPDFEEV
jgi:hypothetical protein